MKIALISRTYWPYSVGGAEKILFEIKNRLVKKNDFKIITWEQAKGKDFRIVKTIKKKVIGSLIFSLNAARIANSKEFDIVHVNQFWTEYSPFFLRKKFVTSIHDLPESKIRLKIVKKSADKAKGIFVLSKKVKKELMNLGIKKNKIHYAPPGIDWVNFKVKKAKKESFCKKGEKLFLYISRIAPNKDLLTIIKALKLIKDKVKFKLLIIGQKQEWTDYYQKVINEIKESGIKDKVLFLKPVFGKELVSIMKTADIYLQASAYGEGFGMPTIECQAAGTPVIVSKLFEEIGVVKANKTGLVFPISDHKTLSKQIIKLLEDNKLRRKLISNGHKNSKEFNWDKTAKTVQKVYEKVLEK